MSFERQGSEETLLLNMLLLLRYSQKPTSTLLETNSPRGASRTRAQVGGSSVKPRGPFQGSDQPTAGRVKSNTEHSAGAGPGWGLCTDPGTRRDVGRSEHSAGKTRQHNTRVRAGGELRAEAEAEGPTDLQDSNFTTAGILIRRSQKQSPGMSTGRH